MPAEIVTGRFCASSYSSFDVRSTSDPTKSYRVSLGGATHQHCTCPAFAHFRGPEYDRTCKHIDYVWKHACLWNEQWRDNPGHELKPIPDSCTEPVIPGEACPACGGPVVPVKIAV